jgi:type I site-specific restriction-modification system R (restriction) subunit
MNESVVEAAALDWLESLGWVIMHGCELGPDEVDAERQTYEQVVLEDRLQQSLALLNPGFSNEAIEEAFRKLTRPEGPTLEMRNRAFHQMLVDGVTVEFRREEGSIGGAQARVLDFDDLDNNDWLAVNQFTVAVPSDEALRIRDDVAFFQAVRAVLAKRTPGDARTNEELDHAIRQIVSGALAPEGVVDIFAAAGLDKPDISILSESFLAEVRGMPQRNLAVELLNKRLSGEIQIRRNKNVVQARSFEEMLAQSLSRYQNRAIEAAQVIEELIELAREMREANARGEALGLTEEEVAFYDALEANDSAVQVLGDDTLRAIARELVATVRANVTIDWTMRENVRAHLRVLVKRILRKNGYPPDKQEQATRTVLEQAEVLSQEWAVA